MNLTAFEKSILELFESHPDQPYMVDNIAHHFNMMGSKDFKKIVKALNFLEQQGLLRADQQGRYRLKNNKTIVEGVYRANARGFGFITYDDDQSDLFVPKGNDGGAMNNDRVKAKIIKQVDPTTGKGSLAQVVEVIERASRQIVGEFFAYSSSQREETGYLGIIVPQGDYASDTTIKVLPEGIHPALNSICIVEIKDYPSEEHPSELTGYVRKEIGHKDEPGVDILSILYQFNIPHEFPASVIEEAENIPQEISPGELNERLDLREQMVITIDGASAKDLDDAISLEKISDQHYRLGVHIADVSYYVKEGSQIDLEARDRGTSVYLTDRVVPMLPQRLSNGICSLLPDEDRLTLSCIMDIDGQGHVMTHQIVPTVIHSNYRMTYDDVNLMIEGDIPTRQKYSEIAPMVDQMTELHHMLELMRRRRGALDFDTKEAEIIVDDAGHPRDIVLRQRYTAERLIESFMLIANETVADAYEKLQLPFIYRIHEQPDVERMDRFAEFITAFGMILRGNTATIQPKQLQDTLNKIKGQPYEPVVSTMMLRSMQQAKYSEEPLGHYGLATQDYTHFTSPIRRYPDLIAHRLIHTYLAGKPSGNQLHQLADKIPGIADHASKMERRAVDAERETEALKKAEFMLDKVGQQFEGVITSVTNFGMFVALPNTVEGLIKLQALEGDYYQFHQQYMMLVGERTGRIFRIGQKVTIEVESVSVAEREIDFKLIEAEPVTNVDVVIPTASNKQKKRHRKDIQNQKSSQSKKSDSRRNQGSKQETKGKKRFKIKKRK